MKIAVLAGDGIGAEVTAQAVKVLRAVVGNAAPLELVEAPIGGVALDGARRSAAAADAGHSRARPTRSCSARAGVPGDEKIPYEKRPGAACCACARISTCSPTSGRRSCSRSSPTRRR